MKNFWNAVLRFWYFHIANPVVAKGEKGGFKWTFRKYCLDIRTVSGNWKVRIVAGDHPYGYLLAGVQQGSEENIHGYAATVYELSMLLTRDQGLVNDIQKAVKKYDARLQKAESKKEREDDDLALKEVELEEEYIEQMRTPRKTRRDSKGRFQKKEA